ncbi:AfsR/SARP family transcriptional regulator [Nocardia terpenica]|uniref:Bacterial transcriptional activator domain-containing protein n=1 Tax=Nocardia terpenica TaxID=455432 RepID=A0A164MN84_9NOCA|nr:BTAD domain-containing putative transcriptional regulator [Nocardia terpenica]KZM73513.1 hypothetical protein AWN90_33370 [Nocardia terpenica]NQE87294.1 hypothetical protein [Nocardia terpenica]QKQ14801.1 Bra12 [Nocardia terpenica]
MSLVRLGLLGPLEVLVDRVRLDGLHQPKQQAVFAMMAANSGRTVPIADLIGGIWGEGSPPSALSALRNYMSSLRTMLRHHGCRQDALRWAGGGYRFDATLEIDAAAVERFLVSAEAARASGRLDLAADSIRAGLRLWRGEALSGVPGPWAAGERARLHRSRETLRRWAIEISIDQGNHEAAIAQLEALVHAEPQSEQWRILLMTALFRAGRRIDALEVYRAARDWFIDTMGLEPSPAMTELHQHILSGETVGGGALAPAAVSAPARPVPSQLPPDTIDFTGRTAELAQVTAALAPGRAVSVVALTGMGGVGKTALAVHVGHRVQDRFPDGRLYVDLRPADGPPDVAEVLAGFLRALGVAEAEIPAGGAERSALFRTVARGKRLLVLLDNAICTEQVTPLLPASAGCAVLVTARTPMTALPVARRVRLAPMEPAEAAELFTRIVADARPAAEPQAVRRVVVLCGGLPLAIRIIAARLVTRPGWMIADEADRLGAERDGLQQFRFRDTSLESAFQSAYDQLDPELAHAFRTLARLDRPDATVAAVAAALGCDPGEAVRLCDALVDRGMLDSPAPGRYRFHDLVRVFARSRPDSDASAAMRRPTGFIGAPSPVILPCTQCSG